MSVSRVPISVWLGTIQIANFVPGRILYCTAFPYLMFFFSPLIRSPQRLSGLGLFGFLGFESNGMIIIYLY